MAPALEALQRRQENLLFHATEKDTLLLEEVLLGQALLSGCLPRTAFQPVSDHTGSNSQTGHDDDPANSNKKKQ